MVSTAELPLSKLAQQLARKQSELEQARRAYEKRLTDLERQKEDLQAQLRTVETEIHAVSSTAPSGAAPAPQRKTPAATPAPKADGSLTLPALLVKLVRAAGGGPITVKELGQAVKRARFQTTSHNLARMVKNKVAVLVKRGVLRRAQGQPGVVLGELKTGKRAGAAAKPAPSKAAASNGKAAPAAAKTTDLQGRGALRTLLVQLLAGSDRPLRAKELADKAMAAGYKTESRDFVNVVWDALGKIKEVENVRGQGYRLKKRPAKAK
jgi:hypothetical protein